MSIRLRLTLWSTVLLALILTGFAVLVYAAVARQLTAELEDQIRLGALTASRVFRAASPQLGEPRRGPPDVGGRGGRGEGHPPGPPPDQALYVQVLDPGGAVLSTSQNLTAPLPDPRKVNPSLDEGICGVIRMMMAKNPDDRYQDMAQVAEALAAYRS